MKNNHRKTQSVCVCVRKRREKHDSYAPNLILILMQCNNINNENAEKM